MMRYMLDTNMVSYFFKDHPLVVNKILKTPITSLCISAITQSELLYGTAKRPEAKRLQRVVNEFLQRVDVLPWNSKVAERYGVVRANMQQQGKSLGSLDLLIAAHALSANAILVTNDGAFSYVAGLSTENWTIN